MRQVERFGLLLLAGAGLLAVSPRPTPAQQAMPGQGGPAAWAMSSGEAPRQTPSDKPIVIATTRPQTNTLPPESRLPLPDDGLHPPGPTPAASGTVRPPAPIPGTLQLHQANAPAHAPASNPTIQQVAAALPAAAESSSRPVGTGSVLALGVLGPTSTAPGQVITSEIIVRNAGPVVVGSVLIELPLPRGVRILATDPPAGREGERLSWALGNLEAGIQRKLRVELLASQAGELHLCPTARFTAAVGLRTSIVKPPFALTAGGPETASLGDKIILQVQVSNNTAEPVRRVALRCELSAGLYHPQGQVIEADLPEDLAPGQARIIQLEIQGMQPGRQTAQISATAEGNRSAQAMASILLNPPTMTLGVRGPRQATSGQTFDLQIDLVNPARSATAPIRVTQTLPQGVEFVSASTGGIYNGISQSVTWDLEGLAAEQRQTITCTLRARRDGDWALAASAQLRNGSTAETGHRILSTHALRVEATPTLSQELTVQDDPVPLGRDSTCETRIYNAGPALARGLRLVIQVPENVVPVHAEGPTPWQIRGQQVVFEPLAELRGRADAVYRVKVRGVKPGQGSIRAELHGDALRRALQQEASVRVSGAGMSVAGK